MFGKRLRVDATNLLLFFIVCSFLAAGGTFIVSADENPMVTWDDALSAKMLVTEQSGVVWKDWYRPFCQTTVAIVEDYSSRQEREVCYVSSSKAQLAVYRTDPQGTTYYGLKKQGDDAFHRISTLFPNPSSFVLLSNDTILGAKQTGNTDPLALYSLENFEEHAQVVQIQNGPTTYYSVYDVVTTDADVFTDDASNTFPVRYIAVSKNEKFATAQVLGRGLVRIDLTTRDVRLISNDYSNNSDKVVLAISNDGNKVAVTGPASVKHRVYVGLDDCGVVNITAVINDRSLCYFTDLSEAISSRLGDDVFYNPEFVNADTEFIVNSWKSEEGKSRKLTFTPDSDNYRLEYLAMGDSYSSGEGDIGRDQYGRKYYLPGTDNGEDSCHISSRSYPFLLRSEWRITSDRMKSVACSGAQVLPDFNGRVDNYYGQSRRLINDSDIDDTRQKSLISFIPGYIPQLEFVKRYKPKLVTFTGGGNDVGFAEILTYCASPDFADFVPWVNGDCKYAEQGSVLHKMLLESIDTQYYYTKKLINDIKNASSQTKIVIVGYPQFIHPTVNSCALNGGLLSFNERVMLNSMVSYMNSMLKRIAHDIGVTYVDVENALAGGKICEGGALMTGIGAWALGVASQNERFHPNASGHAKIAQTIIDANVYQSDDYVPAGGDYVPSTEGSVVRKIELLRGGATTKQSGLTIESDVGTLKPGSSYTVTTFSTPQQLGIYTSNEDGSVNQHMSLEDVEIGNHVIVVEGIDSSNMPTQLYQFIQVGIFDDDADGDGIPDDIDKCQFITEWYDEQTGENLCLQDQQVYVVSSLSGNQPSRGMDVTDLMNTDGGYWASSSTVSLDAKDGDYTSENLLSKIGNRYENSNDSTKIIITTAIILAVVVGGLVYGYKKIRKNK